MMGQALCLPLYPDLPGGRSWRASFTLFAVQTAVQTWMVSYWELV